jgi:hypothetical protein
MIVPPTWIADTYLGRAPSGRSRVLRLSCYRDSEESDSRAEFFVKAIGLPEITEQHLFNEAVGNLLARELGIITPDVGLIEITEDFADLLRAQAHVVVPPRIAVGARSLGSSLSPPVFGRMNAEQLTQAARIYLFDMLVQNPDRRRINENCFVVGGSLAAIDFADCFSPLYPVIGSSAVAYRVPVGISSQHVFRGRLDQANVAWPVLFVELNDMLDAVLSSSMSWIPEGWERWMDRVREHLTVVQTHRDKFQWEILGSVS